MKKYGSYGLCSLYHLATYIQILESVPPLLLEYTAY